MKKQIDILIYTYDNRWTYVKIYVYTNKKSVEIIIVYYVSVATYVYIDVKNPWRYTKIDLFALYGGLNRWGI